MDTKTNNVHKDTEYDLRDMIIEASELNRGIAHTGSTFRRYGDGYWRDVHDLAIRQVVAGMLEAVRHDMRVSLTRATETSITDLIKSKTYVEADQWDRRSDILVFRNICVRYR